ncbi:MAG: hypothetical protein ACNI27_13280 [Desulfovibrio sp.]
MNLFRIFASTVTAVGIVLLGVVFYEFYMGTLPEKFFPNLTGTKLHLPSLILALPVPLHVIFVGLIVQKKHWSPRMAKFSWVGIVGSGMWLGASLAYRTFFA